MIQMTVVMAKQFNYENLLKSIQRYRITHLKYALSL